MHQILSSPARASSDAAFDFRVGLAGQFRTAATVLLGLVAALAVVALAGWILDITALKSVVPGLHAMEASTAGALLATAAAVALASLSPRVRLRGAALRLSMALATFVALASIVEHFTGWNLFVNQGFGAPYDPADRMALTTSVTFLLIQAGIWFEEWPGRHDSAQVCILGATMVALFDGVSYSFGLQSTLDPEYYGVTAIHSTVGLTLLSLAFLFNRPDQGVMAQVIEPGAAGMVLRHTLPRAVAATLVITWLAWHAVLYVAYEPELAMAVVVTAGLVGVLLAIFAGSLILSRFEKLRLTAEAARFRSEARLRRAVAEAPIPIVVHSRNDIIDMSRGWADVAGQVPEAKLTFSAWLKCAQPERTAGMDAYLRSLGATSGTVSSGEQPIRARDGSARVWEFSSTALEMADADGQLFVTMAIDITERKQLEADLRRANDGLEQRIVERTTDLTKANDSLRRQAEQLREQALLLDLVRDGILVRDLYGTIIYWSKGAAELYGWEKDQALGRVSHELLKTEYPLPTEEIEAHVLKRGFWEGETVQVTKSGVRVSVESRWTLTRTERGSPEGFLEVNRDITARKRQQALIEDSELRFRAVSETATEAIMSVDAAGSVRYWNPAAEALFGLTGAEASGTPIAGLVLGQTFTASLAPGANLNAGAAFETEGIGRTGRRFPLEGSVASWVTTHGERWSTVIVRDITARKRAERALETKNEALARSNQELEQFAYVASHDLQEPLRMVSNYTQLLGRRYKDKLDTDAQEFIEFAVDGAKRMQELINDLLAFARVGTRGKEFKSVAAEKVVANALANLSGAITAADAQVVVGELPTVSCDGTQMAQVFQNLVGNAIKFRHKDQQPVVRISAVRGDSAWTFSVQDNGIGIDGKYFDRIFQMFQRLHTRAEYEGTGIGLALCKKIIERHGGRIQVESEPGRSTTFSFTLPDPRVETQEVI